MENSSRCARRKTDSIVGISLVLLLLVIYFSPSAISSRYRHAVLKFPDSGYMVAEDSQQYAISVTITLLSRVHSDQYEADKEFITSQLHLEIYNEGSEPLRGFRWVAEFDQGLQEFLAPETMPWLNDPGIYTRYSMLFNQVFGPRYDLYPQDATLPEASTQRRPFSGFIYDHQGLAFWSPQSENGLDELLVYLQKPIKFKLMHEGGTDYLLVYPKIDTSAISNK